MEPAPIRLAYQNKPVTSNQPTILFYQNNQHQPPAKRTDCKKVQQQLLYDMCILLDLIMAGCTRTSS
jgi:ADP-glucose pyrophosphorylase